MLFNLLKAFKAKKQLWESTPKAQSWQDQSKESCHLIAALWASLKKMTDVAEEKHEREDQEKTMIKPNTWILSLKHLVLLSTFFSSQQISTAEKNDLPRAAVTINATKLTWTYNFAISNYMYLLLCFSGLRINIYFIFPFS